MRAVVNAMRVSHDDRTGHDRQSTTTAQRSQAMPPAIGLFEMVLEVADLPHRSVSTTT